LVELNEAKVLHQPGILEQEPAEDQSEDYKLYVSMQR